MTNQTQTFRLALTNDFYDSAGNLQYQDIGLSLLDADPHVTYSAFAEHRPEIGADQVVDCNGVIVLTPRVSPATLAHADNLLAVGRFGVGYDNVDVPACTAADVVLFITVGSVDRSVAEATVGWMIALTHHIRTKDRLVRTGQWHDRSGYMGVELRDRTFGAVGLGGIAREAIRLLSIFGMNPPLAFDPYVDPAVAASLGVKLVSLDELMAQADFVSVHCPLSEQTRNLIGAHELSLMKPNAYLLNTARGGIVNEDALYDVLKAGRIAGAALDCFVGEPITTPSRFGEFDNVLLAPHAIAWTHELFRDNGIAVCQGMLDLAHGRRPKGVVNPAVLERPGFQAKWERLRVE
ncbi:MAG: NAD(P)-dependent oxidoreductase [Caldilineaceae bacterium]